MATMKIGTTAQAYASAAFTFQVNPKTVNTPLQNNYQVFPIPFGRMHIFLGAGGVGVRKIVLTGETYGSSKVSNFNNLAAQIHDNSVKRLWISDTRFYNVLGSDIRRTDTGGRTNFIDYVASLDCVTPYALSSTADTYTWTTTGNAKTTLNDATSGSSGAFENAGNAPAFITWTIENASGSAITKIEIGDTNDYATSPHKITWAGSLTAGNTLTIHVFKYASSGTRGTFKEMRFDYATVSGTKTGNVTIDGEEPPWIDAGATDQAFSMKLTGNDAAATVTASWHYSYTG